ncbi:Vesicle transport V-snare protein, partial [Dimargaris verticillata]
MASVPGGSDLFESYEQDYVALAKDISKAIHSAIPAASGDAKKQQVKAVQRQMEEAEEILGQMEIEVFNIPSTVRTRLQSRLRSYRTDLGQLKQSLKQAAFGYDKDRRELLGDQGGLSPNAEFDNTSMDQRTRLLAGT